MDTYYDLLQLIHVDRPQFYKLSMICFLQNMFVIYIMYLLYIIHNVNSIFSTLSNATSFITFSNILLIVNFILYTSTSFLFGLCGQLFINMYVESKIHETWMIRGKQHYISNEK
jgi:hypothetical protein